MDKSYKYKFGVKANKHQLVMCKKFICYVLSAGLEGMLTDESVEDKFDHVFV